MWGIIATWCMANDGINKATKLLENGNRCKDGLITTITDIENNPLYKSVGYGGLPNEKMEVECDAAFMNGDDLSLGVIAAAQDIANPIKVAESLSHNQTSIFLTAAGATEYALSEGFETKDMLTRKAKEMYEEKIKNDIPYRGHDTVGCVCLDDSGSMCAGTSTSGLFMKKRGRVGDSPLVGSGYYVDSEIGGATATGLGEDIMKRCVSYEIVRLMEEGLSPQAACEKAVALYDAKLKKLRNTAGDCSVVAMNKLGQWGAASNIDEFSFVVATQKEAPTIYRVKKIENGKCEIYLPDEEWLSDLLSHI